MTKRYLASPVISFVALLLVLLTLMVASLSLGDIKTDWRTVIAAWFNFDSSNLSHQAIVYLRQPRMLAAILVGAFLSLAGIQMQTLIRNPLADPYILGISGGASIGALIAIGGNASAATISISSFIGASISMLAIASFCKKQSYFSTDRVILAGVMLASLAGAIITLILAIQNQQTLQGMMFWLMGSLSQSKTYPWQWAILVITFIIIVRQHRSLDILLLNEEHAESIGVKVKQMRYKLLICASICTALAISIAGPIGFVGLVVPHAIRFLFGRSHLVLIPLSMLLGASFLLCCDIIAKNIVDSRELPVGVICSLIGAPLFVYLLMAKSDFRSPR